MVIFHFGIPADAHLSMVTVPFHVVSVCLFLCPCVCGGHISAEKQRTGAINGSFECLSALVEEKNIDTNEGRDSIDSSITPIHNWIIIP